MKEKPETYEQEQTVFTEILQTNCDSQWGDVNSTHFDEDNLRFNFSSPSYLESYEGGQDELF